MLGPTNLCFTVLDYYFLINRFIVSESDSFKKGSDIGASTGKGLMVSGTVPGGILRGFNSYSISNTKTI